MAIGAVQVIRKYNLRVPEDISIAGFGDMAFADMLAPALIAIRQPINELGKLRFQIIGIAQ